MDQPHAQSEELGALRQEIERLRARVAELEQATARPSGVEELRAARDAAQAAARAKGAYLANISHEIRTPLNAVIGLAGLLMDSTLSAEQRDFARTIRASGEALLELVNDVLDLSRIESGRLQLESRDFELLDVVESIVDLMAPRARAKDLRLKATMPRELPGSLVGDAARLRQILLNFVDNAIKFTSEGEVELRATVIDATPQEARLRLEVRDTGIGIDAGAVAGIFEPFVQAEASTARRHGGSGLGLAICRELAQLMGGAIGADSTPGEGSCFWLEAPFALAPPAAGSPGETVQALGLLGARVLLLEHPDRQDPQLTAILASWKVPVARADSGEEALRRLAAARESGRPFDCVVLDREGPGMPLATFCRRALEAIPGATPPRLLLLSDRGAVAQGDTLHAAGFRAVLQRPVRRGELLDALSATRQPSEELRLDDTQVREAASRTWRLRLLVAEDDRVNQKIATRLLQKLGCRCDVAADGNEAVRLALSVPYDVIFMDCQMPGADGLEATRQIRQHHRGPGRIPIIAMTANSGPGERDRCLAAGMDDHLAKPLSIEALERVLRRLKPEARHAATRAPASPPEGAEDSKPVLDLARLRELAAGDEAFVKELLVGFQADAQRRVKAIAEALARGDGEAARRAAHALRGASANIGAHRLAALAHAAEADPDNAAARVPALEQALGALSLAIVQELAPH